jgi:hypothetical protein
VSRANFSWAVFRAAEFAREVEDQSSGNLTLNHLPVEDRSTNHRFDLNLDHDSSMRTSRRRAGAKVENSFLFSKARFFAPSFARALSGMRECATKPTV